MPTLLEQTQALSERIAAYETLLGQATSITKLQAREAELSALHAKLVSLVAARRLLLARGIDLNRQPKPSVTVVNKTQSLRQMFAQDPLSLTREDTQFGLTFKRPVQDFIGRLETTLLDRWRSYVDGKLPTINERVLDTFNMMGFSTEVTKIKTLLARAKLLRETLPGDESKFGEVDKLAAEINAVWRGLDEIPGDVREFFRLATNGEAKLEDLTESIRTWFESHDLIGALRLSLAK